jgi:hypothetical protein
MTKKYKAELDKNDDEEVQAFVKSWERKSYGGEYLVEHMLINGPPEGLGERGVKLGFVKEIEEKIVKYNRKPTIKVVFVDSEFKVAGFDLEKCIAAIKSDQGVWANGGNHGRIALQNVHRKYPKNKMFRTAKVLLHGFTHLSADALKFIDISGGVDNVIQGTFRKTDWTEMLMNMRVLIEKWLSERPSKKVVSQSVYTLNKDRWCFKWKMSTGSVSQLWSLASLPDELWERVRTICFGEYPLKGSVRGKEGKNCGLLLKSAHYFVRFGNVPEDMLLQMLDEVIAGDIHPKTMSTLCYEYKARMTIEGELFKCAAADSETWEEAALEMPLVFDEAWVQSWVIPFTRLRKLDAVPQSSGIS